MRLSRLARVVNELSIRIMEAQALIVPLRLEAYHAEKKKLAKIKRIRSNKTQKET